MGAGPARNSAKNAAELIRKVFNTTEDVQIEPEDIGGLNSDEEEQLDDELQGSDDQESDEDDQSNDTEDTEVNTDSHET